MLPLFYFCDLCCVIVIRVLVQLHQTIGILCLQHHLVGDHMAVIQVGVLPLIPGIQLLAVEDDSPGLPPPPPAEPITDGPFYAFLGQRFAEGAFGGVMTNEDVEVIRKDGTVIPGLYAVGDAASTWYTRGVLGPLTELTWAVNSGYFAADSAKNYLSELSSRSSKTPLCSKISAAQGYSWS